MHKYTLPILGAGTAALTLAATGAVYAITFHAPNATQNNDYSVVKTKKIELIYEDILTLIDNLNRVHYEPVYITSHDGCRHTAAPMTRRSRSASTAGAARRRATSRARRRCS